MYFTANHCQGTVEVCSLYLCTAWCWVLGKTFLFWYAPRTLLKRTLRVLSSRRVLLIGHKKVPKNGALSCRGLWTEVVFDNIKPLQGVFPVFGWQGGNPHMDQIYGESTKSQVFHVLFPDSFHLLSPWQHTLWPETFCSPDRLRFFKAQSTDVK